MGALEHTPEMRKAFAQLDAIMDAMQSPDQVIEFLRAERDDVQQAARERLDRVSAQFSRETREASLRVLQDVLQDAYSHGALMQWLHTRIREAERTALLAELTGGTGDIDAGRN